MRQQESRGRRNWQKLKNIVRSGTLATKTRQRKLQLFQRHTEHTPHHILTTLSTPTHTLLQKSPLPLYKQLLHFEGAVDTTGRWVWEAEEVATYFFLQSGQAVIAEALMGGDGKSGQVRILQLGAGSSGLAGVALWRVAAGLKGVQPQLQLTDGEADNIPFLRDNIALNNLPHGSCTASALLWGEVASISNLSLPPEQRAVFEVIILCDCLYFQTFHKQLLLTIDSYLSSGGIAYLVNPSRGPSMGAFLALAADRGFEWEHLSFEDEKYQMQLGNAREESDFEEDKHSLFFTKLCRKMMPFHS